MQVGEGRDGGEPARDEALEVLLLAPIGRDAQLARGVLDGAGIPARSCRTLAELAESVDEETGAAVVAEEAITREGFRRLRDRLAAQPSWSTFPLLILARGGECLRVPEQVSLTTLHDATYLERPLSALSFVSAVRGMLESRRRQHEVRDLLRELSRRIRERDEFMAMLGHELRNPLGAIRNATQLLTRPDAPDSARRSAERILEHQTAHLSRLLDDLLEVSRVTRGKIRLQLEPLDVRDVAEHAAEVAAPLFSEQSQDFRLELPDRPLRVEGDATRLEQVLSNLLRNAGKYTSDGGRVELAAGTGSDGAVEVRVRDTGIGMEADTLDEIFEPFTQAEGSKSGLGLGLPLARRLIELHGGALEAHSDGTGSGSEFVIWLPALRPAGDGAGAVADARQPSAERPAPGELPTSGGPSVSLGSNPLRGRGSGPSGRRPAAGP